MAKKSQYVPLPPDQYIGKQAIITSDRVLFNAKKDSILMFANKAIALSSAGTLNFDSDDICIINSPKIQLGLDATEPLLLGNKTVDLLKELLEKLDLLTKSLGDMEVHIGDAKYSLTQVNVPAIDCNKKIQELMSKIEDIKSKQNFTL